MGQAEVAVDAPSTTRGLFVRNATGLVREVSPITSVIINYIPGSPVLGLAYGLFLVFSLYPGGSFFLALLILLPMMLAFAYAFGLLTAAIPRSGGDYMLVSRVVHPAVGVVSSFFMMLSNGMFSCALTAWFFTTLGLGPGLIVIGMVGHYPTLMSWGTTLTADKNWQFGIGLGVLVVSALPLAGGWKWTARIQNWVFGLTMAGLGLSTIVALFTSSGSFRHSFDKFAQHSTGNADTYGAVIAQAHKAGVNSNPPFSLHNTLAIVAVVAAFGLYSYWSANVGGELRQGRSTKTAHRMALGGFLSMVSMAVLAEIFFHSFGRSFLTAAYGGGMPKSIAAPPTYFFLTSAQLGSVPVAVFLVLSFVAFWPLLTYIAYLQPTRMLFAYSFDGLLPKQVAKITKRHSPVVAVAITVVLAAAAFAWAVYAAHNFFQVVTYMTLAQIVAMMLVGVAAVVFPYRRPEMFRASVSNRRLFGIPAVSLAGAGAVLSGAIIWALYFTEAKLGLVDKGNFFIWMAGTAAAAVIFYAVVKAVRRRQGIDIGVTFAEIPPE